MSQDIRTFKNPTGYWEHDGAFSVELVEDADTSIVPASATVQDNVVSVQHGRVKQTMGGIQLRSHEAPFYWGYNQMKCIRDGSGNLLWVNWNHRD